MKTRTKNFLVATSLSVASVAALALPLIAGAVVVNQPNLTEVGAGAGLSEQSLATTVGKFINILLGLLGLVAVIIFVVGGFQWMTSAGNEEKVAGAKKLMSAAIVGIVIIILAWAATSFIITKLQGTGITTAPATIQ